MTVTRITSTTFARHLRGLIGIVFAFALGCSASAQSSRRFEADDPELEHASVNSHGQWESAPWTGTRWLPLAGNSTVTIAHALKRTPTLVIPYLTFTEDDSTTSMRQSFPGAGDIANITDVGPNYVAIHNRTPADYYLRVVLE